MVSGTFMVISKGRLIPDIAPDRVRQATSCASIGLVRLLHRCHISPLLLIFSATVLTACSAAAATAPPGHDASLTDSRSAPLASPASRSSGPALGPSTTLANCPMFPANNVWNTEISKLPVDKHSAAWLASMHSASTDLHPDFGPSGGYPYGIPYTVVTSSHPTVRVHFQYASESDRRPYPFGSDTRIQA